MDQFRYVSYAQEVVFGARSLARLNEFAKRYGWQRLMLCTNQSLRQNEHAAEVEAALGDCLVAVYDTVQPHVQDRQLDGVLKLAVEQGVDAMIGLGGGSPIGMAKAAASILNEQRTGETASQLSPFAQPLIPVIAIPTTYAGSEMTAGFGVTHTRWDPPAKVTLSDPRVVPKLVLYDPLLTLDLPPMMTASTGMNALAHCIEALYSVTRNPSASATAASGIQHISRSILACTTYGGDMPARTEMQLGAHLAGLSLASISMGLHHGVCHVLGGTANVAHGIANSVILPHAVRFNAAQAELLMPAVDAMGIDRQGLTPVAAVEALADHIYRLVGQLNLPQHLREVGVKEADLPHLAELAFKNKTVQNNPTPITDVKQIEKLLRDAW
jgi:maleylacetate reductase